jgi:hypothetical protein
MFGFEFNWLVLQLRSTGTRLRFARRSLLTFLVAGACVAYVLFPAAPCAVRIACLAAPARSQIDESARNEWPRTLLRLWLLLPHLAS